MRISEATRAASFSGLFASESAREILSRVPAGAASVRVLTCGAPGQGFADWIAAAVERWPATTALDLTVWALTDSDWLRAMVRRFGAGQVRVIQDSFVSERHDGKRYREVVELVGADCVRLGATHAKVCLLRGADVVRGGRFAGRLRRMRPAGGRCGPAVSRGTATRYRRPALRWRNGGARSAGLSGSRRAAAVSSCRR